MATVHRRPRRGWLEPKWPGSRWPGSGWPRHRWRSVAAGTLTVLAGLLVLLALNVPVQIIPEESDRDTFVPVPLESFARLPVEAIVFFVLVLALPARFGRVRTALAHSHDHLL